MRKEERDSRSGWLLDSVMASIHHFHPKASLIALLHASKYPSSIVLGCFLGPAPSANGDDDSKEQTVVEYLHTIPLLHHWTGLSFALEAGLQLVRSGD
jgi:hypothetical protein